MAKYRHRIFEMYEHRDEATAALIPKSARPVTDTTDPESWSFKYLAVSRSDSVTHVRFEGEHAFGKDTLNDLRDDLAELSDRLALDSRLLVDFADIEAFCVESINELALFNRQLRTKGSRIVLCCLDPAVRQSFFAGSEAREKQF